MLTNALNPFYLDTNHDPSLESLHLGHAAPFEFTHHLQEAFQVPLVIQLTDDEKFLQKAMLSMEDVQRYTFETARDIIAFGFDRPDRHLQQLWLHGQHVMRRCVMCNAT